MRRPNVLSIPAGARFLDALVDGLLAGDIVPGFRPDLADPLALADVKIYLPTRRAARALTGLIAERAGERPLIMPRIVPLGDVDATEFQLATGIDEDGLAGAAAIMPAIPETERRLILTTLILAWARRLPLALRSLDGAPEEPLLVPASPADALSLAGDLARLMDDLSAQEVDWSALRATVHDRFDSYYAITADFLTIASQTWPAILTERGCADPARRRDMIRRLEAERLEREPPKGPVIAAGSTGTVPSTALLLRAIARAEGGAVVLPGFDPRVDAASHAAILGSSTSDAAFEPDPAYSHPQSAILRLLQVMEVLPDDVREIGHVEGRALARQRLLSEAMRPAETTDAWAAAPLDQKTLADGVAGLAMAEAADEREEALAAAIAMREALEDPDATVALITPDRTLADRVCAELKRWRIEAEDSAGLSLGRARAGVFARLVCEAAASGFAPMAVLALVNHPCARFGLSAAEMARARTALDIGILRGPAPPPGIEGLRIAASDGRTRADSYRAARPVRRLGPADFDLADRLIEALGEALEGLDGPGDLVARAARHREACLAAARDDRGADLLFTGEDGEALASLFDDLAQADEARIDGAARDYPAFFARLALERVVRRAGAGHRRVKIWGLLEARLLSADRVVLGGMAETVWPPAATTDPFLNRPMRRALGLPAPEQRIGQTAHDFVQALGASDVVMTRALKREGKPTIPSRFTERLRAYVGKDRWGEVVARGEVYVALARHLDSEQSEAPLARPAPKPPAALQPLTLSVTEIETLTRDPYAIYARHVLKLDPLDAVAVPPGASDRGTIFHDCFARFTQEWPLLAHERRLPRLIELGREAFAPILAYPDVEALWWPRFERIAGHFVAWEAERRALRPAAAVEQSGKLTRALGDGAIFTLRARADRIETGRGPAAIVDYKTGTVPTARQVKLGFNPQLTLTSAILGEGGFEGLAAAGVPDLLYVKPSASELKEDLIAPSNKTMFDPATLPQEHLDGLLRMIDELRSGQRGFTSRPYPEFARAYASYDHLARVREWSVFGSENGETPA